MVKCARSGHVKPDGNMTTTRRESKSKAKILVGSSHVWEVLISLTVHIPLTFTDHGTQPVSQSQHWAKSCHECTNYTRKNADIVRNQWFSKEATAKCARRRIVNIKDIAITIKGNRKYEAEVITSILDAASSPGPWSDVKRITSPDEHGMGGEHRMGGEHDLEGEHRMGGVPERADENRIP
jgi:hypothetical protein